MSTHRSFLAAERAAQGPGDDGPLFAPTPFDRGMEASAAAGGARPPWQIAAIDDAIRKLAAAGRPFTSDDIWALCPGVPVRKDTGARLNSAARRGLIENTGRTTTSRREDKHGHAQRLAIWIGVPTPPREVPS